MFKYCPDCKSSKISFVNRHFISCLSCDFLYYHNAAASVAAIIECQGEVLFTTRAKNPGIGLLDLPGGFVDHQESLEIALAREITEELSLTIAPNQFSYLCSNPNTYPYKNIKYHTIDSIFTTTLEVKPQIVCETKEISHAIWINKEDININNMAFNSLKQGVLMYLG